MSDYEEDENWPTVGDLCDCTCPDLDEWSTETVPVANCTLCNREWFRCITCEERYTDESEQASCFQSHRTVLDDIIDAVE